MAKRKGKTRAGQLFHLVDIQEGTKSDSTTLRQSLSWATILPAYPANVVTLRGTDKVDTDLATMLATASHQVYLRQPDPATVELSPEHRLLWGSRILEIVSVISDDGNRDINLILMCKELVL
jgi:hypothetical protein